MTNIELTMVDKAILKSYEKMVDGLGSYLSEGYEIVLYSLDNTEHSIVKIINGQYTERSIGSPITKLALSIWEYIEQTGEEAYVFYTAKDKHGQQLKLSTIAIRGENDRIIALLCINHYLDKSSQDVLTTYFENPNAMPVINTQNAVDNSEDLICEALQQAKQQIESDYTILPSLKNREIIVLLNKQGVFQLKNAVILVAQKLEISKNTVYMHLRYANKN